MKETVYFISLLIAYTQKINIYTFKNLVDTFLKGGKGY